MSLDPRDAALYAACPLAPAPTLGTFVPLATPGKRLVAARDGLYLEARSPVLHWLLRVAAVTLPYGPVTAFVRLAHGPMPTRLLAEIAQASLQASPDEIAFGIEAGADGYTLHVPPIDHASPVAVSYQDAFDPDRLVLDIHSHGAHGAAFFSRTDDASDLSRAGPYLAAVIVPGATFAQSRLTLRAVCAPYLLSLDEQPALLEGLFA
jgi:PRTRC genetic system protein A